MSNAPNQNGSGLEQQFADLDLQSRASSSARYVPPHLRNKQSAPSSESNFDRDKERDRGGEPPQRGNSGGGGGRNNYRGGSGGGGGRDNRGDFSSFNTRNRRDNYQNGETFERDDWGRGGGASTVKRGTSAGRKVGLIAARRTGLIRGGKVESKKDD